MTNNFKKQISNDPIVYSIYLQEISNDTFTTPILKIESRLGNKTILNPTENETFYTLCDLAYIPPAICAVK
jgi:hypothetical protein